MCHKKREDYWAMPGLFKQSELGKQREIMMGEIGVGTWLFSSLYLYLCEYVEREKRPSNKRI